jgi:hypothetical protein
VLGRLPLLGGLFRTTTNKKDRTELVVLIRPSVSVGPEDVYNVRDRNMKPMRIPLNLEDDLVLPDPALSKGSKRSGDASLSTAPQLKPFRASADTVQAADASGVRKQATPPPSQPGSADTDPSASPVAAEAEAATKKKKSSKPQSKPSGE